MAATDEAQSDPSARRPARSVTGGSALVGSVVAAALALPGCATAQAEADPTQGLVSLKWLEYRDEQPGLERIRVRSPSLLVRTPVFAERWAVEGSLTADSVSGASPRWHSAISGASRMSDERRAGDVRITRYDERSRWTVGIAASDENDFRSRALSAQARWSTDDNNRSWTAGVALTHDRIGSSDDPELDEGRRTVEAAVTLTQALSRADLVQAGLTWAHGRGFYSDPYKRPDLRPGERRQTIATLRWNHHFEDAAISLRSSWRHYRDSFGIRSHTLSIEPVWQAAERITITPALRLYTQTAAWFYYDPVYGFLGEPFPPGYTDPPAGPLSADHRLSAFGAVTLGLKLAFELPGGWSTDLRIEHYRQRAEWHVGGPGSPGLAPFSARFVQWGLARRF